MLNVLFRFVQETCSHQLNQADPLTVYLLQCKQAASSAFVLHGVHSGLLFCSQGKKLGSFKVRRALVRVADTLCHGRVMFSVFTTLMQSDWVTLPCLTVPRGDGDEVIEVLVLSFE